MKKSRFAALCLLAGVILAACDTSTPVPTPTVISSTGPTSTPAVVSITQVALTNTPTASAELTPTLAIAPATPSVPTVVAASTITASNPVTPQATLAPTGTPGTPTPTDTPVVVVSDTAQSVITETKLVSIDAAQWVQDSFAGSPDRRHVGYISASGSTYVMYIDGVKSNEYVGVLENTLTFSPDSQHYAYGAVKNTNFGLKGLVIIDGVEQKGRYDQIETGLLFSPDSKRVAYGGSRSDKHVVVVDGKESDEYDAVVKGSIRFSPDSMHLSYVVGPDGVQSVVLDGQRQPVYGAVLNLAYSPDSKHVAYLAVTAGITATQTMTAMAPNATQPPSNNPSGKRVIVVDGKESKGYDGFNPNSLTWSPDSKHVAFVVQDGVKQFVVVDGQEGPKYDVLGSVLVFSPDSKKLAYGACNGTCTTTSDSKWRMVVHDVTDTGISQQGREGNQYGGMGSTIVFSPDNQYLAYVAASGGKQFVVVAHNLSGNPAGTEGTRYDGIGKGTIVFSPDNKRLAYVAGANQKQFVVVDGQRGPDYDTIGRGSPVFSTDGTHVAYSASQNKKEFVVLDGKAGKQYDVAAKGGILFDGPATFHYLGVLNNLDLRLGDVWIVDERIK